MALAIEHVKLRGSEQLAGRAVEDVVRKGKRQEGAVAISKMRAIVKAIRGRYVHDTLPGNKCRARVQNTGICSALFCRSICHITVKFTEMTSQKADVLNVINWLRR